MSRLAFIPTYGRRIKDSVTLKKKKKQIQEAALSLLELGAPHLSPYDDLSEPPQIVLKYMFSLFK
jgi:hypothetical protein